MDIKQISTTMMLFVLMSVAMTTEKTTLVWSLQILQQPSTDVITGYSILLIILEGPYLFTLLQILWNVPFIANSKDPQFPGIGNVLLGCFVCSTEAACLVFFAAEVAPILPLYILLPILNSLLLIPIFVEELPKLQEVDILGVVHWRSRYRKWLQGFGCMVACFLPIVLATFLYHRDVITGNQSVALGVTLLGLSIVNCPVIQRYILAPNGRLGDQPKKITFFYTLLKILLILLFLAVHFVHRVPERSDFLHILKEFTYSSNISRREILLPLSLNFLSAMIAHGLAFTALSWCLPVYGILLPSILSVTGAIGAGCGFLDPVFLRDYRIWDLNSLGITSFISLLIWCAPYFLSTSGWTKMPGYFFMPFEALFLTYGWNSLFFDQYLLLSYRRENSKGDPDMNSEKRVMHSEEIKSRIFVCTTMYREADYEMERLLMSLQGLSFSNKFKNIYLEAHIFMDNGFTGGSFSPFAQQLIELVQVKLELDIQNGVCVEMPYGVQIKWTLNGGMPLFINFKDSQKIKAKKRWSQAMYVHYILNFRLKILPLKKDVACSDSSTSSTVGSEQNNALKSFSYKEIKNNSLVFDQYTGTEEYTKPKEWTDMFVVSDRNFDHNGRIGYPTLVSHKPLAFESHLEENKIQDQDLSKGIKGASFLGSILLPMDTTLTETSDSSSLSSISSQTRSADNEHDDSDLTDDRSVKVSFENEAFVRDDFKPSPQSESHDNKKCISLSSKDTSLELVKPGATEDREISKIEENILYSLSRTDMNSGICPQRMNSRVDTQKKTDTKISLSEETSVLPPGSLLELRVDNFSEQSALTRENNLTNHIQSSEDVPDEMISEDHVYILATDADMEFKDKAVIELLQLCNSDKRVGAACGRTHPQGRKNGPIVWHQIFEYAKDFWMIKNAQNVIGSVMCCPGCFSLYRASAIRQVMDKYVTPTRTPFTVYIKDTGEDRWMATLMMVQGWHMRYSCFAQNNTFCPDTFEEFLKQRRRWVLSDIANAVLVVQNLWPLMRRNSCFSLCYVLYMLNMFLNNIITPGTAIVMITAGLDLVFGVPYLHTTIPLAVIVLAYSIICTRTSTRLQTYITALLTGIMGSIFFAVVVWGSATIVRGMIQDIMIGKFHFQQHYVIMLITLSFGFAAAMHPSESYMVFYGFAYVFIFPAMHILLPLYSIANIIDQSWGTRDAQKAKIPKIPSIFRCLRRKKKKDSTKHSDAEKTNTTFIVGELNRPKEEGEEEEDPQYQREYNFWLHLKQTVIGTDINIGLSKTELAEQLQHMRNRSLIGILTLNGLWLIMLSIFYMGISSSLSRLNIYGVISGALYGFTLVIQMLGITACRLDHLIRNLGKIVFRHRQPFWINSKQ